MWAYTQDHFEIVKLLLEYAVDTLSIEVNAKDDQGSHTIFDGACFNGNPDLVKIFMDNSDKWSIDLNAKDKVGHTAFQLACGRGHVDVVKIFLENSATMNIDLNAKDIVGQTAFNFACGRGRITVVKT